MSAPKPILKDVEVTFNLSDGSAHSLLLTWNSIVVLSKDQTISSNHATFINKLKSRYLNFNSIKTIDDMRL